MPENLADPADDDVPGPGDIDVGAAAPRGFRLWLAKEAVRQAEARLTAQNGVRTALETRATAITGLAWGHDTKVLPASGSSEREVNSTKADTPAAVLLPGSSGL